MTNLIELIYRALTADPAVKTVTRAAQAESGRDVLVIDTVEDRTFTVLVREITKPNLPGGE